MYYKDTYVTLETLALELNIDYQLLLKKLKENKIMPVEDCFYNKRKIYLRNDIKDVDLLN
ncbi:hypothetical protein CVD23_16500 [Bacillus sp. V33-4]|nr:hypothetical protein CVD23_16500 [Bacillus sp. V33-4]